MASNPPLLFDLPDGGSALVRVGSMWAVGQEGKRKRIAVYTVIGTRRQPRREVLLWDGIAPVESLAWVPLVFLIGARRVRPQGNLQRGA